MNFRCGASWRGKAVPAVFLWLAGIVGAQAFAAESTVPYGVASWHEAGRGNHRAVVHVAQAADEEVAVLLTVDWDALGIPREQARITAPRIEHFQESAAFSPDAPLAFPRGQGLLLVVDEAGAAPGGT